MTKDIFAFVLWIFFSKSFNYQNFV